MMEMASSRCFTKVSRAFPWAYTYTSRVNRSSECARNRAWRSPILQGRLVTGMKKIDGSYVPIVAVFALSMALAPVFRAQDQGSITRITTIPEGASYLVDGQPFNHS